MQEIIWQDMKELNGYLRENEVSAVLGKNGAHGDERLYHVRKKTRKLAAGDGEIIVVDWKGVWEKDWNCPRLTHFRTCEKGFLRLLKEIAMSNV